MIVASFDVDAQKGFTPQCPGELPVNDGHLIVDALNSQAKLATIRVGSKDAHCEGAYWETSEDKPIFSEVGMKNVDIRWPRHCVVGTFGGQLLDGLPNETEYDYFVWKGIEKDLHPYGACYHDLAGKLSTGVIEFLKSKNVDTVIVGGLATDYCVKTTAIQLKKAGFKVVVNLEACKGISKDSIDKAIEEMMNYKIEIMNTLKEVKNIIS